MTGHIRIRERQRRPSNAWEPTMNVSNSVAFVTGANRGLGLAFVRALLAGGARKVYAAARDPDSIKLPGVTPVRLDVTNADEVEAAARARVDVDLLINNAGISRGRAFLSPDAIQAARAEMETNYFGPLLVSRAFSPILARNGGGAIVNVLSALSWVNLPTSATYSASKAAAWSLTNGLRGELRTQGTQVLGLHVGYMDTDMTARIDAPKSRPEDVVKVTLAALEAGGEEVLADEVSRSVKQGLSAERGVYLGVPGR
jgi:NAD(P)-dependent dehydrogenase (short-subunit alcohol dehydrogenase family)